jgi:lipopolysaccharide export system permease protein
MKFDFREMAFRVFGFFKEFLKKVFRWVNANLVPFKNYDMMVYRELAVDYLLSFLIISLIVWLKEIYLIYTQYIQKGAQFSTTLRIFLYSLPYTMAITIPAGMVMAAILTFNKMSINLEVLAIRGIGIRKIRMFLPVLVFSLLVSALGYWFFDTILIRGNEMYIRENIKMRIEKPFIDVVPGQFITLSNFKIGFVEAKGSYLEGIEIYQDIPNSTRIVKATRGEIVSTGDEPYYVIKLYEGSFLEKPKGKKGEIFSSQFKYSELRIDYEVNYIPKYDISRSPRVMSRYKVKRIIEKMEEQKIISNANKELAYLYSNLYSSVGNAIVYFPSYVWGMIKNDEKSKSLFNSAVDNIKQLQNKIKSIASQTAISEYNIFVLEYHKKTSVPFSAVFYGLVGFVFGMLVRIRTGKGESLIIGIFVILIQTYLTMIAEIPVRAGELNPVLGAWIGNIVIGLPALYLLFREKI